MQERKYFLCEEKACKTFVRKKSKIIQIKFKMDCTNVIHSLLNLCKFQANIIMLQHPSISNYCKHLISLCSVLS